MLEQVLPASLFAALLSFARVGSAMLLLPASANSMCCSATACCWR
jgi:hypothetical protein